MLKNIFLISDADGTLLTDDKRVLDIDRAAIRELIENGGIFTIATGRGVSLARAVAEELELNFPAVIFNGAAVYDFKRERFLWRCNLPDEAKEYIKLVHKEFPWLGLEILRDDEIYVISTNRREEEHLAFATKKPVRCSYDDVPPDSWIKTLFVGEPEEIDELIKFSKENNFNNVHLVRSAPIFYEMLPYGANKGTGYKKLLEIMGLSNRYVVAAGDFMNDLEMLKQADLGVAVMNAEEIVKSSADLIVCDNNSGAISEIVEFLKKGLLQKLSLM
ncbi:MAG: Cof-type HAD-IIB family hydrolase [Oscillospiraceae bacterium]|nr:Cof-type HAD-IIB family hydrolase [Oscillospiraceae bacterium]